MATRIGVDVGGTFTDLVFEDEVTGVTQVAKVPSTSADPAVGVLEAIKAGVDDRQLASAEWLIHGHTVGLNALLERRGAVVGLLATCGFRDLIEIRRGDRADPYDLFWKPPAPLAPRRLRIGVRERMLADGTIHTPLEEEEVARAAEVFSAEGVECVAIAFMNAYANPAHELRAAEVLARSGFAGQVSLSHAISGEYREYERTSTTLVDAYIRPRISQYLEHLAAKLRETGLRGRLLVARSGGGASTFEEARRRPCDSIMSGPVGGAQGAARLVRELNLGDAVTADVGGTSFDTCMVIGGRPVTLNEGEVVGFPLQTAWVDVRSIGAGGGSVAYVDAGGLLRVGPQSTGAQPGPACYQRGGTLATVTDAALLLGMLGDGRLAGGMLLDRDAAALAHRPLADRLGLEMLEVARGVMTIAAASMANAIREITIEQGRDPRELTLIAFGGAGPLFGCLLARELRIAQVVVPPLAGNFSARGLLGGDVLRSTGRTRILALDDTGTDIAGEHLLELLSQLRASTDQLGVAETQLDLRYVGQEHTLTLDVELNEQGLVPDAVEIGAAFNDQYSQRFGIALPDRVEIVALRVHLRETFGEPSLASSGSECAGAFASAFARSRIQPVAAAGSAAVTTRAFSMHRGEWVQFALVERAEMTEGERLQGPAIITEQTATTYLDAGFSATSTKHGLLLVDEARVGAPA
jgi:N-methylhydantoinase A